MVPMKEGVDVDIGANPSAEGGDDDGTMEEGVKTVNNVVYSFRLQETSFDKKSFMAYIKVPLYNMFGLILQHCHCSNCMFFCYCVQC